MPFSKAFVKIEMQTGLSRVWTWITNSISYDDNCFAKRAFGNLDYFQLPIKSLNKNFVGISFTAGTYHKKRPTLLPEVFYQRILILRLYLWQSSLLKNIILLSYLFSPFFVGSADQISVEKEKKKVYKDMITLWIISLIALGVLWEISNLFRARINEEMLLDPSWNVGWLGFYSISALVGYLRPNPIYIYIYIYILGTSLMSSFLLLQQCPACLVRLTWIVFVMGGRWPYS